MHFFRLANAIMICIDPYSQQRIDWVTVIYYPVAIPIVLSQRAKAVGMRRLWLWRYIAKQFRPVVHQTIPVTIQGEEAISRVRRPG